MVVMMMLVAQQPGAYEIDRQAQRRDRDRFAVSDRDGVQQAIKALIGDQQGDHAEHDRACVARQVSQLAGAEGEAPIGRVAASVPIRHR